MKTNVMDLIKDKARLGKAIAEIIEELDIKQAEIAEINGRLEKMEGEYENLERAISDAMEIEKE